MFVRWKHRRLRRHHDVTHYAVLVENTWYNGATHQRVLCYLAHIRERFRNAPAHRAWFWQRVQARLDGLVLEPNTRAAIEKRLAKTVPPPTSAELAHVGTMRTLLKSVDFSS